MNQYGNGSSLAAARLPLEWAKADISPPSFRLSGRTNLPRFVTMNDLLLKPSSSGDRAADALSALRKLVAERSAAPDDPLPTERALATRLGISRRVLREALFELEAEGKIWRRQGKGTFVGPAPASSAPSLTRLASRTNFYEIMEVRLHLEPSIAQLAAHRASADQVAMILRLADKLASATAATPPATLERWDSAFHRSLAEAAGNRLFLDLFEVVDRIRFDTAWQTMRERARTPEGRLLSNRQHRDIAEAVAARDSAKAAAVMRQHIASHQDALHRAMAGPDSEHHPAAAAASLPSR